jgi:aspartyl-tRNA synthetase
MKLDIAELNCKIGEKIIFLGWAERIRSHKNVAFIDLRDRSGVVQAVVTGGEKLDFLNKEIKTESLLKIEGLVKERPEKLVNPKLVTGGIEVDVEKLEILSSTLDLPFVINEDTKEVSEALRLKYRYLDLRSERMRRNLEFRHKFNLFLRNYFSREGFWEIETPFLAKGTPEGSREYIVPSRLHQGEFFVLPQSPQQFKQLLMVGGVEKYFQIVRCFRDEDQRSDRQPEFTQLDYEMSFVEEEDVLEFTEKVVLALLKELVPEKNILKTPFPRLTYAEAMAKYKTDKPDLRSDGEKDMLAFCWITDFPLFEESEEEGRLVSAHHPFTAPKEEDAKFLEKNPEKARAKAYDLVLNGYEVGGGSIRIFQRELQEKIFKVLGLSEEETKERFGHMLEAFEFSPPPHGGMAWGLDRFIALLMGEENIREVIAFPKTGDAKDLLMGSPSPLPEKALREAGVELRKKKLTGKSSL